MKTSTFIFVIVFGLIFNINKSEAQNYQTVNSGLIQYYKSSQLLSENIQSAKIDSANMNQTGDSILYFHRIMRDTSQSGSSFGDCVLDTMAPCWLGSHAIIEQGGENLFFNKAGDTIRFKTNAVVGENWLFLRQQDYYLQAKLDSLVYTAVKGANDSVMVMSLQAYNNSGTPVTNWFNDKKFRLSEHYGFAGLYSLYDFPQDTSFYESYSFEPLTNGTVFDFEPGDIFHFGNGLNYGGPPQYSLETILAKWFSAGNDTVYYRKARTQVVNNLVWDPDPHIVTTLEVDTVTVSYANPASLLSELMPHQKKHDTPYDIGFNTLSGVYQKWNGRPTITFDDSHTYDFNPDINCYIGAFEPMYFYHSYTKGCGISYSYYEETSSNFGYYIKLKYFKKGTEVWGDPYILTSTPETMPDKTHFDVYPNPFTDRIEIRIETKTPGVVGLFLYSLSGVLLVKIEEDYKQPGKYIYNPDFSYLTKGVYVLKLISNDQCSYQKIIRN